MDHSHHTRLSQADLTPSVLEGATIYDAEDHKVGTVSHVHGLGAASEIVVDVGGFLGIGAKPVAVRAGELDFMRDDKGDVVHRTQAALEELGYETADGIVDLWSLGVAQTRRRHIMVIICGIR